MQPKKIVIAMGCVNRIALNLNTNYFEHTHVDFRKSFASIDDINMAKSKYTFSVEERSFAVLKYCETKSLKQTIASFSNRFGIDRRDKKSLPNKTTILRWVEHFKESGSVESKSGLRRKKRAMTMRTDENIAAVKISVDNEPKKSIRRRSMELEIPRESLRMILKSDLKLRPYTIQLHQRLSEANARERLEMCHWFLDKIESDAQFIDNLWFSDEAHFYMNGYINSKNYVFWGSSKPDLVYEKNLHDLKVTAWVAMNRKGIIGPFFFMDENQNTVTVNSGRYINLLKLFWKAMGRMLGVNNRAKQWFQQDGATPHCAHVTLQWLNEHFDERIISRRTPNQWAPHSPDLNPLDFHLWGFLKDQMMGTVFESLEDLRNEISRLTQAVPQMQCQNVIDNFCWRLRECIRRGGGHMEHML